MKHTGTVTAEELFDELANELANVDDDYLEMVSAEQDRDDYGLVASRRNMDWLMYLCGC